LWIENRFGCDDKLIRKFKLIEKEDLYYKNLAKEKKKIAERRFSMKQGRATGRTVSMSLISSVTDSELASSQQSRSEMDDSFAFD